VAWDRALDELFTTTVQLAQVSSVDMYGKRTYGSNVAYSARVIEEFVRIVDFYGRDALATHTVWIRPTSAGLLPTAVTPDDRLTLADGTVPNILGISTIPDEDGDHHIKIYCGRAQRVN